jgi:Mrp family chromosome partitioning ATPase/capsular polysaccharide biosynthesis protein
MDGTPRRAPVADDWLRPPREEEGLSRYARTVRERLWTIIAIVVVTTGIAVLYVATAGKVYEAEADLLVNPVPNEAELLIQLGLTSQSADPTREVQTVARLVTTDEVAQRAREELRGVPEAEGDVNSLLDHVTAEPIADSNLVAITGHAADPSNAAEIANAFATAMVAERTSRLRERIDAALADVGARGGGAAFGRELAQLEALRAQNRDPTIEVATQARPPSSAAWPRPALTFAGALLAGLVLGLGAAFTLQALDPRLRREEQLRDLYRLPILARIPRETKGQSRSHPLVPATLSPATLEAYRALRGALALSSQGSVEGGRVVLVTGSSPSEGKTTTAINLATLFASAGNHVILIEADLRRPAIGEALGIQPQDGVVGVLLERVPLEDALVTTERHGPLRLLLADYGGDSNYGGDWISELFAFPAAGRMLEEARRVADYVVIDSPPLTDVVDALPLTTYSDDVLIVTRIGTTRLTKLARLGELLAESGIRPVGFAVVGVRRPAESQHYFSGREPRMFRDASREPVAEEAPRVAAVRRARGGGPA